METPIPTPFDIIPPPPGAWIPSLSVWIVVIVLAAVGAWWGARLRTTRGLPSIERMLQALLTDLATTVRTSPPQPERVSRIARRIISQHTRHDLTGLSSSELREHAATLPSTTDARAASLAEIITIVADLEDQAYAPRIDGAASTITQTGEGLLRALETHSRRFPPS